MMTMTPHAPLRGCLQVPGDKSISHRAVMLGALAQGESQIDGFLMGEDCLSTISCLRQMGVKIDHDQAGHVRVQGVGLHGLKAPGESLNTGNSGTTTRLLCGILAAQGFSATLSGDRSLNARPMKRVTEPLRQMGADIADTGGCCPLHITGGHLTAMEYTLPVASAQLKSALILAGLYARGTTLLHEPSPSRDHTERMLRAMGAQVESRGCRVSVQPARTLSPLRLRVPGDPSSAAFFLVAALLVPGSEVTVQGMLCNPTRTGFLTVLQRMGADLTLSNHRREGGEPVCDCTARHSALHGVSIGGDIIPSLIDEIPILAVAAAYARGETVIADAAELKVKESDRIAAMTRELSRCGADIEPTGDGMIIRGGAPLHGADFHCWDDHRIAMAMAVCALGCQGPSTLDQPQVVAISYPDFFHNLDMLGGDRP